MRYQCKVACILKNHYFLSRGIDLFKVFYSWLSWSKSDLHGPELRNMES